MNNNKKIARAIHKRMARYIRLWESLLAWSGLFISVWVGVALIVMSLVSCISFLTGGTSGKTISSGTDIAKVDVAVCVLIAVGIVVIVVVLVGKRIVGVRVASNVSVGVFVTRFVPVGVYVEVGLGDISNVFVMVGVTDIVAFDETIIAPIGNEYSLDPSAFKISNT